jgi:hypothetical protein
LIDAYSPHFIAKVNVAFLSAQQGVINSPNGQLKSLTTKDLRSCRVIGMKSQLELVVASSDKKWKTESVRDFFRTKFKSPKGRRICN